MNSNNNKEHEQSQDNTPQNDQNITAKNQAPQGGVLSSIVIVLLKILGIFGIIIFIGIIAIFVSCF